LKGQERCLSGTSRSMLVWLLYCLVGAWLLASRLHSRLSAKNLSGRFAESAVSRRTHEN